MAARDEKFAYQLYIDRSVKVVTLEDLISCCETSPSGQFLEKIKEKIEINDIHAKMDSSCRTRTRLRID